MNTTNRTNPQDCKALKVILFTSYRIVMLHSLLLLHLAQLLQKDLLQNENRDKALTT